MAVSPQSDILLFIENNRVYNVYNGLQLKAVVSHTYLRACKQLPSSGHSLVHWSQLTDSKDQCVLR